MVCHTRDVWAGAEFQDGVRLRSFGFHVALRPRFGEPTWKLGRVTYSHQAALQYCRDLEVMSHESAGRSDNEPAPP